jgi:hypothetical protein
MGYDGKGIGNMRQGILSSIVATMWVNHKGLGFDGKGAKPMTIKAIFVKANNMLELACSSREGVATVSEYGIPLPPQPSCGIMKEGNNEKSSQT